MSNQKLKIVINYDELEVSPYGFSKRLIKESGDKLFETNSRGSKTGINYFNFAVAASRLMDKILEEKRKNDDKN